MAEGMRLGLFLYAIAAALIAAAIVSPAGLLWAPALVLAIVGREVRLRARQQRRRPGYII